MRNIILLIFLTSFNNLRSQNQIEFRNILNEGNYWFYEQNFDSALFYYNKAEKLKMKFYPEEVHLFSRTLWELGFQKKSIKVLKSHDGLRDFFVRDTTYYIGLSLDKRNRIGARLKKVEVDLLSDRMFFFDSLHVKDQMYRRTLMEYPDNSPQKDSIIKLMSIQDSINFFGLIEEIKTYGYPGGHKMAPVGPGTVLLHSKPEWLLNNYSIFMKEINEGRMSFFDFSKAIDRMFVIDETQRPYNSYMPVEEHEVASPIIVFVNRCSIGMSPYYDIYLPRLYPRGKTPPKSKLYEYYKRLKENFNCCRII